MQLTFFEKFIVSFFARKIDRHGEYVEAMMKRVQLVSGVGANCHKMNKTYCLLASLISKHGVIIKHY